MSTTATDRTIWDDVIGQPRAVQVLQAAVTSPVHAYLFVGPAGSTKETAARAFAAALIGGSVDPTGRDARLAMAGKHPDVHEYERVGPAISAEQARAIATEAAMAPTEGARKVLILHEFHLLRPEGAALLLKSIEEPAAAVIFVVCADSIPSDLVTIASRCVRVEFRSIADDTIVERLVAEGVSPDAAAIAASTANGNVDRARLLASDPKLGERRRAFATAPYELDGSGAAAFALVDQLLELIEESAAPLTERHEAELEALNERIERTGERGSGKKQLEERHKRELRRHRTDELVSGLTVLAGTYRDVLVAGGAAGGDGSGTFTDDAIDAVSRIHTAMEALFERNPNETLLLQSLLWSLPPIRAAASS